MDPKNNRKSYSDLEAIVTTNDDASTRHQSYWNAKFLAAPNAPDPMPASVKGEKSEKDVLKESSAFGVSPVDTIPPPPPAYYLVDAQGQTRALYAAPASTTSDASSVVNFKAGDAAESGSGGWWKSLGNGRRIFGMRKNIFLAVLAGVLALILGLLATILVVTRAGAGRDRGPPPPAFSTKELLGRGDSGPLLAASDLAAMNWTDTTTATPYSGVFYQSSRATGSALMLALKNEKTQTWSSVNISASASKSTLDVLPGTPLAAATNNGLWNLYYLTSQGTIAEVYSQKPTSVTGWEKGSFADVFRSPAVMPGSGLGAMWQSCISCDNALYVTWQNADSGALVYANMTNLTWGSPITLSTTAAPGTPAAVSAFTDTGSSVRTGPDHTAIRWYYASGSALMELLRGPVGKFKIVGGNFDKPITTDLETHPSPKLASLTYGTAETGWTSNILSYICPIMGSLTAANWIPGSTQWTVRAPTLSGSPDELVKAGFSSVAMTQEMRIYLLSPSTGQINEFLTSVVDPFNWAWQGQVDTS